MPQQDVPIDGGNFIRVLRDLGNKAPEAAEEIFRAALRDFVFEHTRTKASDWRVTEAHDGVLRTPCGVLVSSKDLVMKVFDDPDDNYTVSGYGDRTRECIGEIYLCLDKGAEYDRQSEQANAAIQSISASDAFAVALRETRFMLAFNPDANNQRISDEVLAKLCRHWFDLPDGEIVLPGGLGSSEAAPRCGRDVMPVSGYTFYLCPDPGISWAAKLLGPILKQAVLDYVLQLRASGESPKGALSKAIFEAFPEGDDDLVARTIIGVMMGMVPTVDGNLTRALNKWQQDGTFDALKEALAQSGESDPYLRARAVLRDSLIEAMQLDPAPDHVWRTAVKPHTLGSINPVEVRPGDKISVNIMGATHEDHQAGFSDPFPVFGGDRRAGTHPTHACPGYEMAMGIMLGIINGVMEPQNATT